MKRIIKILFIPFLIGISSLAFFKYFIFPAVGGWGLQFAQDWTQKNSPVHFQANSVNMEYFPPKIIIEKIKLTPNNELSKTLSPVLLNELAIEFNLFDLFFGQLQVGSIVLDQIKISLNIDPLLESKEPPSKLPIEMILEWASKTPLRQLVLKKIDFDFTSNKLKSRGSIKDTSIVVQNQSSKLIFDIALMKNSFSVQEKSFSDFAFETKIVLDKKSARILHASLRHGDLELQTNGLIEDVENVLIHPQFNLHTQIQTQLPIVKSVLEEVLHVGKIPALAGEIDLAADIVMGKSQNPEAHFNLKTHQVQIADFEVGDADVIGKIDHKSVQVKRFVLNHTSGSALLNDLSIQISPPYRLESQVNVQSLDLQKLFVGIHLKEIPVWLQTKGKFNCNGQFQNFKIECVGGAELSDFSVKTNMKQTTHPIVQLKQAEAQGAVTITNENVDYSAQIKIGNENGKSSGQIRFAEGFKITFQTPQLSFQQVGKLAGMEFAGATSVEGWVEGNASTATFEMDLRAQNFEIEKHFLGITQGHLRYFKGNLQFENLTTSLPKSEIQGNLNVDLLQDKLKGQFTSEKLELSDIALIFNKIYSFPLSVAGSGKAEIQFDGPFAFWKLNTKVISQFQKGTIHGDRFDTAFFDVNSENGNYKIQRFSVNKQASKIEARGGISAEKDMDIHFNIKNFRLEESQFINSIRQNLAGNLIASADLTGNFEHPLFKTKGTLSEVTVDEQDIANSFFDLTFSSKSFEGNASLFGNKIQTEFRWPFSAHSGPLVFKAQANNWSFTSILGLIGAAHLQSQYESQITGTVDLKSDSGDYTRLSGKIEASETSLRRGSLWLKSTQPISISAREGIFDIQSFNLSGPNNMLQIKGDNFSLNNMDISVQAQTDLRLLHMLTPFLDDIGGPFQLTSTMKGPWYKPSLLGNANIKNGFFKLKGFPHSLEKVSTQIIFSHSKVLIQDLQGQMASGNIKGEGTVQINQIGDIPTQIRIKGDGLHLQVPEKVKTSGDAELVFSGHWFPFILSGTYTVKQGLVEMEFDSASGMGTVKQSSYLPKILKKANFDPVILDLQLRIDKNCLVKNSQMDGSVIGNLHVKGPPQNPGLLGKLQTDKGSKIIFKDKTFDLTSGSVQFTTADEINPEVYIAAQSRVSDYDINVLIQGPAKTPNIRMSSTPPLPEQDIISLLALGVTSAKLDQSIQSKDQANQLGYEALGIGLSKTGIKKGIESTTGLNFQISSNYDTTKNISVPKMVLNKKITKKLNASYSRTLGTEQSSSEMKLQYEINNSVSAVGSYEEREGTDSSTSRTTSAAKKSIFGLDLEFKREFK